MLRIGGCDPRRRRLGWAGAAEASGVAAASREAEESLLPLLASLLPLLASPLPLLASPLPLLASPLPLVASPLRLARLNQTALRAAHRRAC